MFKENYIINGKIVCETGLHIGGSSDSIEIGGSDNIIIRDSVSKLPFIPGSSLKGKLRSLLELSDKKSAENVIANKGKPSNSRDVISSQIFGVSASDSNDLKYPTRIIVRDSFPTDESLELWSGKEEIVAGAELKYENTIDRITSAANPRNIERVPKGSSFNFEIIFTVYEGDNPKLIENVFEAMLLLEDNYLGGGGSRGFGKIRFNNISVSKKGQKYYKEPCEKEIIIENANIPDVIEKFV